jgi:hypothetical protein
MEIENIIRDIRDLIHDVKTYESNAYHDKADADQALDRAMDRFGDIEAHLLLLIERIEREALSHKIQSR